MEGVYIKIMDINHPLSKIVANAYQADWQLINLNQRLMQNSCGDI